MGQLTKQFGKIKISLPIPHLLNLQIDSYQKFLQEGLPVEDRKPDEGLEGVFRTVFPIEDFNKTASLEFVNYEVGEPKYDQAECISKGLTYEAPMRIKVRLVVYDTDEASGNRTIRDIKEQDIYFGTLPLMTEKGTFIINGTERVIVNQLQRSPGIIFEHDGGKRTPAARCSTPAGLSPCAAPGWILTLTTRTSSTSALTAAAKCPPPFCSRPWA